MAHLASNDPLGARIFLAVTVLFGSGLPGLGRCAVWYNAYISDRDE